MHHRYFSLDDPWRPKLNRKSERAELLEQIGIAVDEILNANERPNWLHPAMFHKPLTSAICSVS